ncbi:hypothetical protein Bbelb_383640 [Branchiostoma belcheri]|nr:hypothetical protein Bbelb_383640 [Branchiostoma belcheri]
MLHAILKDKRKFACTCDWHTANLSDTGLLKYACDSAVNQPGVDIWDLSGQVSYNRKRRQERANVLTPRVLMAARLAQRLPKRPENPAVTQIRVGDSQILGRPNCCLRNQWVFGAALLDRDLSYDSANWGGGAEPPAVCVSAGEGDCPGQNIPGYLSGSLTLQSAGLSRPTLNDQSPPLTQRVGKSPAPYNVGLPACVDGVNPDGSGERSSH